MKFDELLGDGATAEVMSVLAPRFNLDGAPIPGQKVGLVDYHQLWCLICDPFSDEFRYTSVFCCSGGLHRITTQMIAHFVPDTEEDYANTRAKVREDFEVSCLSFSFYNVHVWE